MVLGFNIRKVTDLFWIWQRKKTSPSSAFFILPSQISAGRMFFVGRNIVVLFEQDAFISLYSRCLNLHAITMFYGNMVFLGKREFPVSRTCCPDLLSRLNILGNH